MDNLVSKQILKELKEHATESDFDITKYTEKLSERQTEIKSDLLKQLIQNRENYFKLEQKIQTGLKNKLEKIEIYTKLNKFFQKQGTVNLYMLIHQYIEQYLELYEFRKLKDVAEFSSEEELLNLYAKRKDSYNKENFQAILSYLAGREIDSQQLMNVIYKILETDNEEDTQFLQNLCDII